jgi:hypothetical protein
MPVCVLDHIVHLLQLCSLIAKVLPGLLREEIEGLERR